MAFYLVERTDVSEDDEVQAAIVRASGRRQALEFVTKGLSEGRPYPGFLKNGSNARVVKLVDGRDASNGVILAAY